MSNLPRRGFATGAAAGQSEVERDRCSALDLSAHVSRETCAVLPPPPVRFYLYPRRSWTQRIVEGLALTAVGSVIATGLVYLLYAVAWLMGPVR